MKKVISILLCISVLCSLLVSSLAFADSKSEVIYDIRTDAIFSVLKDIGAIQDDVIGTLKYEDTITRGKLAELVFGLLNQPGLATDKIYFTDAAGYPSVHTLAELGIFKGTSEKIFQPEATATNFDAYIALLRVLGYGPYMQARKMSVEDMAFYASRLGICSSAAGRHDLTLGELIHCFYNSLTIGMNKMTGFSDESVTYAQGSEDTILSVYYHMYVAEGSVTANCFTDIFNERSLDENELAIDDNVYTTDIKLAHKYLGQSVEAYVLDNNGGTDHIVSILVEETESITIARDELGSYNNFKLTYTPKGTNNDISLNLPTSLVVIYNNEIVADNYEAAFNFVDGQVTLYKNEKIGNGYSIAVIESYRTAVISGRDTDKYIIYTDNDNIEPIEFDSTDKYTQFYDVTSGSKIAYMELLQGNIISVKQSLSGKITEGYLCQGYIQGTIDGISGRNQEKLKISGTEYTLANDYTLPVGSGLGYAGKFYLNTFGQICGVEDFVSDNKLQGYVYQFGKDSGAFDTDYMMMVYDENGTHQKLKLAKKVKVDGVSKSKNEVEGILCPGLVLKRQLVIFGVNKDGEVNYIDTSADKKANCEAEGTLYTMAEIGAGPESDKYRYDTGMYMFRPIYPMQRNVTKVITVPPDTVVNPTVKDFAVMTYSADAPFVDNVYNVGMYKTNDDDPFVETVVNVVDRQPAFFNIPSLFVVSRTIDMWDAEENEVRVGISGYYTTRLKYDRDMLNIDLYLGDEIAFIKESNENGSFTSADYVMMTPEEIKVAIGEGDIVQYQCNAYGEVVRIALIYDCSENKTCWGTNYQNLDNTAANIYKRKASHFIFGDVERLFINTDNTSSQSMISIGRTGNSAGDMNLSLLPTTFRAIVVDRSGRETVFREAALSDIVPKNVDSTNYSKLFMWKVEMFHNLIVIYN